MCLNLFLFILFLGELMNERVKEFVDKGFTYVVELANFGNELKSNYARNNEVADAADNLSGILKGLGCTVADYLSFVLSRVSNIKSTDIVSDEEAKEMLEKIKKIKELTQ